jgi:hypothetical protein
METPGRLRFIDFNNAVEWESWLANHYDQQEEAWLI